VGERLICVHVDHGMMRKNETELLRSAFDQLGVRVIVVDARERFLRKLEGVTEPEQKRHIIGDEFIRVFEEEAAKLGQIEFLTQGTLYPDVIESATSVTEKAATKIKTHHNVGGLPEDLSFQLIEPLRYLFKDEVRAVGKELGLPESMVQRQPFPGPGLAIRIIGEVTPERLDTLREADWIVVDEIKAAGLYRAVWQSFAILTPIRSVGVMGDGRTYANVVAVRAVTSEDAMTADWAKLPYEVLARISARIVNEVPGVNRVVYDISSNRRRRSSGSDGGEMAPRNEGRAMQRIFGALAVFGGWLCILLSALLGSSPRSSSGSTTLRAICRRPDLRRAGSDRALDRNRDRDPDDRSGRGRDLRPDPRRPLNWAAWTMAIVGFAMLPDELGRPMPRRSCPALRSWRSAAG